MNKKHKTNWKFGFTLIELLTAKQQARNRSAFTLIELLIVISIIGILTGISVFALTGSRESARDTKRKTDLEQIRSALEIYKADCSRYPLSLPWNATLYGDGTNCLAANKYIETVPQDTLTGQVYGYKTSGTPPTSYTLCAALEGVTTADARCSGVSCGSGTCSYSATNP